jgi:hypothetical protein
LSTLCIINIIIQFYDYLLTYRHFGAEYTQRFSSGHLPITIPQEKLMKTSVLKRLTLGEATKKFGWGSVTLKSMIFLGKSVRDNLPAIEPTPKYDSSLSWEEQDRARTRAERQWNAKLRTTFADTLTLADVLLGLNALFNVLQEGSRVYDRLRRRHRGLIKHLVKIGFTQLDCVALSTKKPSFQDLQGVPVGELCTLDAVVLGTLSHHQLDRLRISGYEDVEIEYVGRRGQEWRRKAIVGKRLAIADILAMKPQDIHGKGAARTIVALRELGFTAKDGQFLSEETDLRQKVVGSLIAQDGLSRNEAMRFTDIAAKRNWI